VAQDRDAARLMGISIDRMFILTWIIAGLLTGAAGILIGPMWFADVNMGDPIALKAFAASSSAASPACPAPSSAASWSAWPRCWVPPTSRRPTKDGLVFLVMILFLLVRPQGIFGERIGQRA